jgi:hypothetical protein
VSYNSLLLSLYTLKLILWNSYLYVVCSKLKWHGIPREDQSSNKNLDIHGTTNSKIPCEQEQKPNDPNGEHLAEEDAKDVIRSPRKALSVFRIPSTKHIQLTLDPETSQHMVNTYNKKFSNVVGFGLWSFFVHFLCRIFKMKRDFYNPLNQAFPKMW